MKYLTSGPSGVLSISYHGLCIFTKLKISWQVLLGMLKKSQESHLSTKIGSHLFFEDVLVDWVSSFFSFSTLGKRHFVCFCGSNSRWKYAVPTLPSKHRAKVIYPKYSKHWLSTVAHTIDCVCSKILNHGLLFSLFMFLGLKNINLKIQD